MQQEIEETAEETPAATAEAPSAVQDDQGLVDKWYAEAWRPECLKAGLMPSREDDLKAAKRAFDFLIFGSWYAKPEEYCATGVALLWTKEGEAEGQSLQRATGQPDREKPPVVAGAPRIKNL